MQSEEDADVLMYLYVRILVSGLYLHASTRV